MSLFDDVLAAVKTEQRRCVVRVKTSAWSDHRGVYFKRDILYMRRLGDGHKLLSEDASMVGANETTARITNLHTVPDGLYECVTTNEHRDWETGYIEDYGFLLVPYKT